MYVFRNAVLFLIILSASYKSIAGCTNLISSANINYGTVVVQRDSAVNSAISNEILGNAEVVATCQDPSGIGAGNAVVSSLNNVGSFNSNAVFSTSLNGVGITIGVIGGFYAGQWNNFIPAGNNLDSFGIASGGGSWSWTFQPKIQFIKTSTAAGSGILSGQIGYYQPTLKGGISGGVRQTPIPLNISGNIVVVKCSISTPMLTFPIGNVLASNFGSTVGLIPSGAQNTQNLGLGCDAGANINVILQGTQNPDVSTTSVLALTGQGNANVAKGVGVQLLYNGTPLVLNNRLKLKQSAGGQETFPITARYYQTKTSVSTGKANASATLDLTYQ